MKNKKMLVLSLLGFGLLFTSCSGGGETSSTGEPSNTTTSESTSLENPSSSEQLSEVESEDLTSDVSQTSEELSSEQLSEEEISSEIISSEEKTPDDVVLKEYLNSMITTQNYTIKGPESTRYYMENAYFVEDDYDGFIGYAEDANGIFSYGIENGLVINVNYLKDSEGNNVTGLYSYSYGKYSWIEEENYLVNSFANSSAADIVLNQVGGTEAYTIPFSYAKYILNESYLQNFMKVSLSGGVAVKSINGTCTISVTETGMKMVLKGSYSEVEFLINDIGTTNVEPITNYIANGGVQQTTLYTDLLKLFNDSESYKITYSDGFTRYVTPYYVIDVSEHNAVGYTYIVNSESEAAEINIHPVIVSQGTVSLGDAIVDEEFRMYAQLMQSYFVDTSIFDSLELSEDGSKLSGEILDDTLNCDSYFTIGGAGEDNCIGKAEITADLTGDNKTVTFVGTAYNETSGSYLSDTYTAVYSDFNTASYDVLEAYLANLN